MMLITGVSLFQRMSANKTLTITLRRNKRERTTMMEDRPPRCYVTVLHPSRRRLPGRNFHMFWVPNRVPLQPTVPNRTLEARTKIELQRTSRERALAAVTISIRR